MSRYYEMSFDIGDDDNKITSNEIEKVFEVINFQWNIDDNMAYPQVSNMFKLWIVGRGSLCGGESEEEFVDRISKKIWASLNKYIPISITATYLEELPYEEHYRNEEDYKRLTGKEA